MAWKKWVPSGKLTWQLKIPFSNREYIFKRAMFHCHVSLPENKLGYFTLLLVRVVDFWPWIKPPNHGFTNIIQYLDPADGTICGGWVSENVFGGQICNLEFLVWEKNHTKNVVPKMLFTLRIMGSQNWWFGDPRPLPYTSKPLYCRVQWFLGHVWF